MKKSFLFLILIFTAFALQAQRNVDRTNFRAGINGGFVLGDFSEAYSFGLGIDVTHHWGVSKMLDVGVASGFFNAFGSEETITGDAIFIETEFSNLQYLPLGASFRVYPGKNVGFKFGGDVGYAVGINEGNEGALYYRPTLGIDLRDGSNEFNVSYMVVNHDVQFSTVMLSYLFLF